VHVVSLVDTPILQYINDTLQFSKSIMIWSHVLHISLIPGNPLTSSSLSNSTIVSNNNIT
jgi:hypothetical protein